MNQDIRTKIWEKIRNPAGEAKGNGSYLTKRMYRTSLHFHCWSLRTAKWMPRSNPDRDWRKYLSLLFHFPRNILKRWSLEERIRGFKDYRAQWNKSNIHTRYTFERIIPISFHPISNHLYLEISISSILKFSNFTRFKRDQDASLYTHERSRPRSYVAANKFNLTRNEGNWHAFIRPSRKFTGSKTGKFHGVRTMIRILDANKGGDRRETLNDTHGQVSGEYFDRNLEPFRTLEMHVISTGEGGQEQDGILSIGRRDRDTRRCHHSPLGGSV